MANEAPTAVPIYDLSTPEPTLGSIAPHEVQDAVASGKFSLPKGHEIPVVSPDGVPGTISAEEAPEAFQNGYKYQTPELARHAKYGTLGQQVKTFAEGAASALTFGASTGAEIATGLATPEDIRGRREENPISHGSGQLTSLVGSAFIPGLGEANAAREAGLAAKAINPLSAQSVMTAFGEKMAGKLGLETAEGLGQNMARHAIKSGVETAIFQGGDEISKMLSNDPSQSVGSAAVSIGLSGLLGSALGSGIGAVDSALSSKGAQKAAQFFSDFKNRILEHLDGVEPPPPPGPPGPPAGPTGMTSVPQELSPENPASILASRKRALEGPAPEPPFVPTTDEPIKNLIRPGAPLFRGQKEPKTPLFEPVTPEEFVAERAKNKRTNFLSPTPIDELKDHQLFMTKNRVGYALSPEGDLQGVFNNSGTKGAGEEAVIHALQNGATTLDAYDGHLPDYYSRFGFELKNTEPFNDKYAPRGWNYEKEGRPDVVYMGYPEGLSRDPSDIRARFEASRVQEPEGAPGTRGSQDGGIFPSVDPETSAGQGRGMDPSAQGAPSQSIGTGSGNVGLTAGQKAADAFVKKGLIKTLSGSLAGAAGSAAGAVVGHPIAGLLLGGKTLEPFFESILPGIMKPFLENDLTQDGLRAAIKYGTAVIRGETLLNTATKNLFKAGQEILPGKLVASEKDREKIKEAVIENSANPSSLMGTGGAIGQLMPEHQSSIAQTSQVAMNYLNSQRPKSQQPSPLDTKTEPSKAEKSLYDRTLDIAQQPLVALDRIREGILSPKDITTMQTLYPGLYENMRGKLYTQLIDHVSKGGSIPYTTKMGLSLFLGQPLDSTMTPGSIQSIQQSFTNNKQAIQAANAMKAKHSTSSLSKTGEMALTPLQSSQARNSRD